MSYDQHLADRVREELADEDTISEKAMFGGLALFAGGNIAVCINGDGLMVRVGPEGVEPALEEPHTRPFDMGGRTMKGWIYVDPAGIEDDEQLGNWVRRGLSLARSLPPK